MQKLVTIERFILDNQPQSAKGELTNLLYDIALAAKIISFKINRAGLQDVLGMAQNVNIQGEEQQKLDVFADRMLFQLCDHSGRVCVMASEEQEDLLHIPPQYEKGNYALVYDPLDGSSNIDVNVSIGTIFGIYRTVNWELRGRTEDLMQPARSLVAAGYVLYGSSTMMVYSTGQGVHGFTLDPELGEFLLSHSNMRVPEKPLYYSLNAAYYRRWSPEMQAFARWLQGEEVHGFPAPPNLSSRYIGSLVSDFHRNLLRGGIFVYPAEIGKPDGKIRLLYEAGPLSFLINQAGGYASTGFANILDLVPQNLHQRVPFFIGNKSLVETAEEFLQGKGQNGKSIVNLFDGTNLP